MVGNSNAWRDQSGIITLDASGNRTVVEGFLFTKGHLKQTDQTNNKKFKTEGQRKQSEFMFFGVLIIS